MENNLVSRYSSLVSELQEVRAEYKIKPSVVLFNKIETLSTKLEEIDSTIGKHSSSGSNNYQSIRDENTNFSF